MAKFFIQIKSDTGKTVSVSGNEWLEIDITARGKILEQLTVREGEDGPAVFNANDDDISTATGK